MQKVNWVKTARGGYGYTRNIAAVIISSNEKSARIAVYNTRTRQVEYKSVKLENLTPREKVSLPLDEIAGGQ